ncbi:hypothetical protein RAC89_24230 [Paenibacillus sp. GD4]|jgi:hypothetical protein|uniref:hypothetical protein n=1 Tax=Paenibacillus sp. GD4 TaxID=3068890 RepID=UPI002796D654|nr:hypothetical protein [Paenibacillus sp. GD4]MDQ1913510.1 hypothetical protein [Paenibacillus sp. GD4]
MQMHSCKPLAEGSTIVLREDAWRLSFHDQECVIQFCPFCGSKLRVFREIRDEK